MNRKDVRRDGERFSIIGRRAANSMAAALVALCLTPAASRAEPDDAALARASKCMNCHALDQKVVGPPFRAVAARYANDPQAEARLAKKIVQGGAGAWGVVPMPSNDVTKADAERLARWVLMQK